MERMNGEVRDREKVMPGLKRTDTVVLTGYQLSHNYIRPHEALNGKTPAEKCGIIIEGENKWLMTFLMLKYGKKSPEQDERRNKSGPRYNTNNSGF